VWSGHCGVQQIVVADVAAQCRQAVTARYSPHIFHFALQSRVVDIHHYHFGALGKQARYRVQPNSRVGASDQNNFAVQTVFVLTRHVHRELDILRDLVKRLYGRCWNG
jgi:hypothetical protein